MLDWKKILLSTESSLENSIKVLHEGGCRIALVVDSQKKLLGTLTDGDIRRALMNGTKMSASISNVINKKPITAKKTDSRNFILSLMKDLSILHVPIVDDVGVICGLETLQHLTKKPSYHTNIINNGYVQYT